MPVTQLIAALFLVVGALLAYGAYAFGWQQRNVASSQTPGPRIDMRWEVLWTGLAAVLLLAVFAHIR